LAETRLSMLFSEGFLHEKKSGSVLF